MLFHNFKHRALSVTRGRTGEQRANCLNGLTGTSNHSTHVAASKLQFKDHGSAAGNFREHHVVGKLDQLAEDELEKLSHQ